VVTFVHKQINYHYYNENRPIKVIGSAQNPKIVAGIVIGLAAKNIPVVVAPMTLPMMVDSGSKIQ
jgi:hypothetical protein